MSQNLIQKQHEHPYPEDNRQSTTNSSINKGQNGFRFQFINKILHNNHPITTHQNIAMRPIKLTKIIDHNQAKKSVNAKDILKKTILREPSISSFGQRTGDNFLMKGRMLQGFRKPIQYQMQSFLLSINERIIKQMQKSSAGSQLPTLSKYNVEYQKINSQNIIENIKKMHSRRISQKSSVFNITARINNRSKNQSQMKQKQIKNQTISYSTNVQNLKKETTLTSNSKLIYTSNQNRMEKQAIKKSFVKGYLYYDDEAKQFLKQFRGNMLKTANSHNLNQNQITAKTYMVVDCTTLTPLYGKNIKQNIEIASISKVMTCYLTIMICKKYDINMCTHLVRVSEKAAEVPGTTAQLQAGDILTVYQLLLGLMLPSGNDASVAIAQSMGKIIQKNKKKQTNKTYYQTFITHMNLLSKQLELDQTWSNSSGLSYYPNYSSAEAIIVLTSIAIKNKIFNEIVCCKSHQIQIKNDRYGLNRRLLWKNTNKLLEKGWAGVKTGTTQAAGHCLMARKENILVCVFNCQSLSRRFSECLKLYEFYKSNQAQ